MPSHAQIFTSAPLPRNPLKNRSITAEVAKASTVEEPVGMLWDRLKNCLIKVSIKIAIRNAFETGIHISNGRGLRVQPRPY